MTTELLRQALVLMQAASKSGDPGAISLAAQLTGAAPCKDCGYVNFKCRCQPAPATNRTHCRCEWEGDIQVQQCTLHAAHVDAIHEWAERAKAAEAAQPAPVPDKATPDYVTTIEVLRARIAALESAAPVPMTATETRAELWNLAVRKGLVTVHSSLVDERNYGTKVSWIQGHDKACDISNDAAAHGIAASGGQK